MCRGMFSRGKCEELPWKKKITTFKQGKHSLEIDLKDPCILESAGSWMCLDHSLSSRGRSKDPSKGPQLGWKGVIQRETF